MCCKASSLQKLMCLAMALFCWSLSLVGGTWTLSFRNSNNTSYHGYVALSLYSTCKFLPWLVLSQSSLQQFESLFWCSLGVGVAWRESSTGIDWSRSEAYMWWEAGYFAHESCSAVHTRCTKPAPHHVTHYRNADKRDTCNWGAYEAIYPCHTHFQRQMQQSHKHCQFIASRTDLMIIVDIF